MKFARGWKMALTGAGKLYVISKFGQEILAEAVAKAGELFHEVVD